MWRRQHTRTDAISRSGPAPLAPYRLTLRPAPPAVAPDEPLLYTDDGLLAPLTADAPGVRIVLLGVPEIKAAKRPRRRSTIELLAYLALHPDGATRDALLEALWPGQDPRRSRPRLWQAVSEARRLLPEQALLVDRDRYQLQRSLVSVDVDDLDQALTRARDTVDPAGALAALERAFSSDIAALNATRAELIERLTRARLATGNPRGALEAAEQGLAIDELSETFARLALQAEGALGLRDAIIRRYDLLTQRLDDRLGLHPASETRSLYHQLLAQA